MPTTNRPTRLHRIVAVSLLAAVAAVGCASDEPDPTVPDGTPAFDPDVPEGVDTETDEGDNLGFDDDEPSGNNADVND